MFKSADYFWDEQLRFHIQTHAVDEPLFLPPPTKTKQQQQKKPIQTFPLVVAISNAVGRSDSILNIIVKAVKVYAHFFLNVYAHFISMQTLRD